jgi:hypothetical protein
MISIYERRRREPIYFQMRAGNALQAARLLEGAVLEAEFIRSPTTASLKSE